MLAILSDYINDIPPIQIDGNFGSATQSAVQATQRWLGLPETGIVDRRTWDEIYDQFSGIENTTLRSTESFPNTEAPSRSNGTRRVQGNTQRSATAQTTTMTQFPGRDLSMGAQDPVRQEVVR